MLGLLPVLRDTLGTCRVQGACLAQGQVPQSPPVQVGGRPWVLPCLALRLQTRRGRGLARVGAGVSRPRSLWLLGSLPGPSRAGWWSPCARTESLVSATCGPAASWEEAGLLARPGALLHLVLVTQPWVGHTRWVRPLGEPSWSPAGGASWGGGQLAGDAAAQVATRQRPPQ